MKNLGCKTTDFARYSKENQSKTTSQSFFFCAFLLFLFEYKA